MKNINITKFCFSLLIFIVSIILSFQIFTISQPNQLDKQDYAEIGHIKYGLLSVNKWKEQIALIVFDEMEKLNLTKANEAQLKKAVEIQLDGLIDKVGIKIKNSNKGSVKGWMKQSFIEAFVDIKDIKKGIPDYADAVIIEMTKSKTERDVKGVLKKRIQEYFNNTFEGKDLAKLNGILIKAGSQDIETAKLFIDQKIQKNGRLLNLLAGVLIALTSVLLIVSGLGRKPLHSSQYILMASSLVVLLVIGVTTPMIDLEAKISELSFFLLDHPITFVNQVLFFQSKSIIDVFWIMLTNESYQMKAVGILIASFSIVIPIIKLASSVAYYYNFFQAKENRLIQFFVLKSGKWSMADVMIVSIFMAYIGFNGIITSQLGSLNSADQEIVILSTSGTILQPGFYIFLSYTILSLFFSGFLTRKIAPSPTFTK